MRKCFFCALVKRDAAVAQAVRGDAEKDRTRSAKAETELRRDAEQAGEAQGEEADIARRADGNFRP